MSKVSLELEHALGFTPNLQGIAFHPAFDRSTVLYSCGKLLVASNLDNTHDQRMLLGHDASVSAIDVSSSGTNFAAGQVCSVDGTCYFYIWDFDRGEVIMRISTAHKGRIEAIRYSPDGMLIATTGSEASLAIWDANSGKRIAHFQDTLAGDDARAIQWGSVFESGTRNQKYHLAVPFSTGVRLFVLTFSISKLSFELECVACQVPGGGGRMGGYVRKYNSCAVLNNFILCGTASGEVMVFSSETGLYRTSLSLNSNGVNAVVAVDAMQCAFVGGGDGRIKKIGGADSEWKLFGEITVEGSILCMAPSSDGAQIVVTTTAGLMYRILTADMTFTLAVESPLQGINDVALSSARTDVFATASSDCLVRLWDLNDYSISSRFTLASTSRAGMVVAVPTCCTFECGKWQQLLAGYSDGRIRCIDVSQQVGQLVWAMPNGHKGKVHTVRACALFVASAGEDSIVRIWQRSTNALVAQLQDHRLPTTSVLIDNTTPTILHSIGMDMMHNAYDLSKNGANQNPRRISAHSVPNCGGFVCASQRFDGEHEMIVGTADGRIFFFDLDVSQKPVLEIADRNRVRVSAVEASPDGKYLAAGLADGSILVYKLGGQTCEPSYFVQSHSGAVTRCAWTADSKQIVSSSTDGDLMVWNFFVAN